MIITAAEKKSVHLIFPFSRRGYSTRVVPFERHLYAFGTWEEIETTIIANDSGAL